MFGAIVSRWFERARGTAISMAMAGGSLGQFVLVPLFTLYYLHMGWRSTMFWMGLLTLVVNARSSSSCCAATPRTSARSPTGVRGGGAGAAAGRGGLGRGGRHRRPRAARYGRSRARSA